MDDIWQRARADRATLEQREQQLTAELESLRAELAKVSAFLEVYERYASPIVGALTQHLHSSRDRGIKSGTKGAFLENAAISVIERYGKPLSIQTLVNELAAQNIEIGGERPATNLAGVLSRSSRVRFTHGMGWDIVRDRHDDLRSESTLSPSVQNEPPAMTEDELEELLK